MKKRILTITAAAALAITTSLASAEPAIQPELPVSGTSYSVSDADAYVKVPRLTGLDLDQVADTVDYKATYPYVLMSYFADMYIVASRKPVKQQALAQRMKVLEEAGFFMVTDTAFLPDGVKSLFISRDTPHKVVVKAGLFGGFYHEPSQFQARLFLNPEQKKVVIAIAGTNFASPTSINSAYSLSAGKVSRAAEIARIVAVEMQLMYPDFTIELTGASQGGAVAQYAAVEPGINGKAIIFNSQAINPSVTSGWSNNQLKRINHYYLEDELLNGGNHSPYAILRPIENKMPVDGTVIPINPILESYIFDDYYKFFGSLYYVSPGNIILHWTGSILEAFEYYAGYNHLPSLY